MNQRNLALVLEDDPLLRRAIVRGLSLLGFICESAASIAEAARMSGPWDVAIVDIDLPDGSGVLFAETSLLTPATPRLIFFSASEDHQVVARANALGLFISKAEGIGAVLEQAGPHRDAPGMRSRIPAPPTSGARGITWATSFDEPARASLRATK